MILSVQFCPYHFVRTILSVPFWPLPFCPRTPPSYVIVIISFNITIIIVVGIISVVAILIIIVIILNSIIMIVVPSALFSANAWKRRDALYTWSQDMGESRCILYSLIGKRKWSADRQQLDRQQTKLSTDSGLICLKSLGVSYLLIQWLQTNREVLCHLPSLQLQLAPARQVLQICLEDLLVQVDQRHQWNQEVQTLQLLQFHLWIERLKICK